ncbi:hypothetical protein ACC717_36990, partial [Rhizobium ruizarguesonis]
LYGGSKLFGLAEERTFRIACYILIAAAAIIGIATLLMQVPLHWGLLHQAGALVVFGFAVANWRGFYGEYTHGTMIAERE